ncbi:MAG TPA: basic amino acid ABC transporter substrate-binding protein [Symbiobacteriaceae bacterium]|nr:basic amino acid ABC transporter substrate-binding protein [Symbiobacteriaceae bacterium]
MKRFFAAALALTLALSLTACGGAKKTETPAAGTDKKTEAPAAPKTHLDEIKAAGKIVLGTSADYPPYEFHKTVDGKDKIVGWEIEMAEEIAKDLGVKLEIKESAFDNLIADLSAKKVDFVISAMTITDKRKENVDFSEPYWKGGQSVLVLKDNASKYKTTADFKGKTIGVQLGTTGEEEAKKIDGAKVKPVDKFEATILDLLAGKVDAVICGYTVGKNYEKNNPKIHFAMELSTELNGVAFRKGDKELVAAVNASLKKLTSDGRLDKLVAKYEAEEAK